MSLFRRAAALGIKVAQRATGITVTLRRGEQSTSDVPVAIGKSTAEVKDASGFVVETASRDYLIQRAHYTLGGVPVEPLDGDQIVETIGDQVVVWELLPLANEPAKRFWDEGRTVWRCHTQQLSEQPVAGEPLELSDGSELELSDGSTLDI